MSTSNCYCATDSAVSVTSSLQCRKCQKLFHLGCLKSGKPSPLEGDLLFKFLCDKCSLNATEHVSRLKLHWTHVVQLSLYNLHLSGGGKCNYFRWREHICKFIDTYWTTFFGFSKKKKTSWHGTVAGTLSAGCPRLFLSGVNELKEPGWWKLADPHPPSRQDIEQALAQGCSRSTKKSAPKKSKKNVLECLQLIKTTPRRCKGRFNAAVMQDAVIKSEEQALQDEPLHLEAPQSLLKFDDPANLLPDDDFSMSPLEAKDLEIDLGSPPPESVHIMTMEDIVSDAFGSSREGLENNQSETSTDEGEAEEEESESSMSLYNDSTMPLKAAFDNRENEPNTVDKSGSICMKGIGKCEEMLLLQRLENYFDNAATNMIAKQLRRKLIVRQLQQKRNLPLFDLDAQVCACAESKKLKLDPMSDTNMKLGDPHHVLDRYRVNPVHSLGILTRNIPFRTSLLRQEGTQDVIISPYTGRVLKAYIWKDVESKPMKVRLLEEIAQHYARRNPDWCVPTSASISYCYVQPHHIPAVNALCHEFFWEGIDVSESLQYPEFSCVAVYKKLLVGFALMVPDVKFNEAYISFLFTHPDWRNAGIATFMLFHLINICKGKDVTSHASATNPAILLYQKLGFKVEDVIVNFYDKYLAKDSKECRTAKFLRLCY